MTQKQANEPKEWADMFIQHARTSDDDRDVECGSFAANRIADHIEQVRAENHRMRELLRQSTAFLDGWANPKLRADIESFLADHP